MITVWPEGLNRRSQWRTGTRETEVRLDGWCDGGHRLQRNDRGGGSKLSEKSQRVESPGACVDE